MEFFDTPLGIAIFMTAYMAVFIFLIIFVFPH